MALMMLGEIVGRERQSVPVTAAEYRHLESHEDFWRLATAGVVGLERRGTGHYALRGEAFVGQAVVGDRLLRIEEKIPGALASLLETVGAVEARITEAPTLADRRGQVLRRLAERFLDALGLYLIAGRAKRYVTRSFATGLPRGKVDLGRSMQLRAQGRADLLAFRADILSPDLLENRLLGLALRALDHVVSSWDEASHLLTRIRTAAVLFEDVGWPEMARWSHDRLEASFAVCLKEAGLTSMGSLLGLARIFALHFGIGPLPEVPVPVSWFVNLESLFEDAVRQAFRQASEVVGTRIRIEDWRSLARHVFISLEPSYRAEPDIVVAREEGILAVLDAKYKDLGGQPSADDVYQILAHAKAWGTRWCALVYPSDKYSAQVVGITSDGTALIAATVNVNTLAADCRTLLATIVKADLGNGSPLGNPHGAKAAGAR